MDSTSMDHYEKQLYSVFKTFDVGNEEALDRGAVLLLCDALQLEERGAALAESLFSRSHERVTFAQFRNGLLSVLGAPAAAPPPAISDEESSGREVAPKLVVGSKKYGRRSRPPSAASPRTPSATSPRTHSPDHNSIKSQSNCKRTPIEARTEIASTSPEPIKELDHDKRITYEQSLDLCRSLHMEGIDQRIVQRIFQESMSKDMTIGDFFDHLNTSLTMSIASTCEPEVSSGSGDESCWSPGTSLTLEVIIETWERAGIDQARNLLSELGFSKGTIHTSELSHALDSELKALPSGEAEARGILLQAALCLQKISTSRAKQQADASKAENTKLRSDLADANRRAQTLAQEVDENHAKIESTLKGKIRQLESRHAEETRAATAEWTSERDRLTAVINRLEGQVSRLTAEENKLRAEANTLREENDKLTRRASLAEEKVLDLEKICTKLTTELKSLTEVTKTEDVVDSPATDAFNGMLDELRVENKILRDRNDELVAELETAWRGAGVSGEADGDGPSWREEVAARRANGRADESQSLPSLLSLANCTDDCDQSLLSLDHKMFGQIEMLRRLNSLIENLPQVPLPDNGCESCATLKGIITKIQDKIHDMKDCIAPDQRHDTGIDASVQTDLQDAEVEKLGKMLSEAEARHKTEKEKLSNLVRNLETSLEELKVEYDKNDEYWNKKFIEEREIYNEEQRQSDERLSDLIGKISEYEQLFAPKSNSNALPTIDEKYSLELQFNDLEDEFDKYKKEKEKLLTIKNNEIKTLQEKIKSYEEKLTNGHNGSNVSSPIDYLWSQGTIVSPYKHEKSTRDYRNPAFVQSKEENVQCASDGEKDKQVLDVRCASDGEKEKQVLNPIQRPVGVRSSSAGALREDEPQMINCAELEGRLRQQAQSSTNTPRPCACAILEARCRQLMAALRQRQMCLDAVQQAARAESNQLRARVSAAETAVARLQARLTAADLLVKDLYVENCQLAHQQTRLL